MTATQPKSAFEHASAYQRDFGGILSEFEEGWHVQYLARTSTMADNAIAKFENVLETDFAKRPAKREVQKSAK